MSFFHLIVDPCGDLLSQEVARLGVSIGARVSVSHDAILPKEPWTRGVRQHDPHWLPAVESDDNAWVVCGVDFARVDVLLDALENRLVPRPVKCVVTLAPGSDPGKVAAVLERFEDCAFEFAILNPGPLIGSQQFVVGGDAPVRLEAVAMATLRAAMQSDVAGVLSPGEVAQLGDAMMIQ
jgi:hypothetical protein